MVPRFIHSDYKNITEFALAVKAAGLPVSDIGKGFRFSRFDVKKDELKIFVHRLCKNQIMEDIEELLEVCCRHINNELGYREDLPLRNNNRPKPVMPTHNKKRGKKKSHEISPKIESLCAELGIKIEQLCFYHYRLHMEEKGSYDYWPSKGTIGKSFGSNFSRPADVYEYLVNEWSIKIKSTKYENGN